jgi:hypothetical protein
MALRDFQTTIGRLVRISDGGDPLRPATLTTAERSYFSALNGDAGFRFTVKVQRSWCEGRAAKAAFLTLSILPEESRRMLLHEWTSLGGGTRSLVGAESAAFLQFISKHLIDPSHESTVCMLELAALRASEGARHFERPSAFELDSRQCRLQRGHYAGLVRFHAQPQQVLDALIQREPLPTLSPNSATLLFGPGLDRLHRTASRSEVSVYEKLASPTLAATLFGEGIPRESIENLLEGGVVEYAR